MGAAINGAVIIGAGCEIGVPMAKGAPSTAGATLVPQGEPLWKKFRQRPKHPAQPLLVAVRPANANRIANFLMIGSPQAQGEARMRKVGGGVSCFRRGKTASRSNSTSPGVMCKRNAGIFHSAAIARVLKTCYAWVGRRCAYRDYGAAPAIFTNGVSGRRHDGVPEHA